MKLTQLCGDNMFQTFDLLFYRGNSSLGKIIKFITGQQYSHVCMFLDQYHTLETTWNKPSVITHFSYKYNDYDIYKLNIKLSDYQKQLILHYITEHISYRYDWIYLITRGLNLLFGTRIFNLKSSYNCDELICKAFENAGIHLIETNEILTPSTLAKSKYLKRAYL